MVEYKRLSFLNHQTVLVDFEVVLLQKNFECNVSTDTSFKEILLNIEKVCLSSGECFYDFKEAVIMCSLTQQYCDPLMTLKESKCHQGSKYYIY